jgi:hypothetical protein
MQAPEVIVYEGVGETLEEALRQAHDRIPALGQGKDYTLSRVIDWGMQYGGIAMQYRVWVRVVEDRTTPPKPG